jgi:hypothetical protein
MGRRDDSSRQPLNQVPNKCARSRKKFQKLIWQCWEEFFKADDKHIFGEQLFNEYFLGKVLPKVNRLHKMATIYARSLEVKE